MLELMNGPFLRELVLAASPSDGGSLERNILKYNLFGVNIINNHQSNLYET